MDEFNANLLKGIREFMLSKQQHEAGIRAWDGENTKGFEITFQGTRRGVPTISGVLGLLLGTQNGSIEAILSGYVAKNNLRSVVSTFTLTPCAQLATNLREGLASLAVAITNTVTIDQILKIRSLRDKVLNKLTGKDAARLAQTNKSIRAELTSPEVDKTFWRTTLRRDFRSEKVMETIIANQRFFKAYGESQLEKKEKEAREPPQPEPVAPVQPQPDPLMDSYNSPELIAFVNLYNSLGRDGRRTYTPGANAANLDYYGPFSNITFTW